MVDAPDLARLIGAVAREDREAFRALYRLAAPKLFGLVLRMVRNRPAAEDVLQDVFLKIWTRAPSYAPEAGEPFAWMAAIARNRAIDLLRVRTPVVQAPAGEGDWLDTFAEPGNREGDMMNAAALRFCLARLDEDSRACVMQAYCEGFSREELAALYERPVNTIKTWLRRGLAALKICLDANA